MSLRIHCFQQVPFEDLGCIKDWCKLNNHVVTYSRFFENATIPSINDYDWMIVMGGPMGIYDYEDYPWLKDEQKAIGDAIKANKTVIGICLGSQFIANVLGGKVYAGKQNEIGWFPINLTNEARLNNLFTNFDSYMEVFHWHGDTYDIPNGATRIAYSELTPNQGFLYKNNVIALQFHFEVTKNSLNTMIENCGSELIAQQYVQTAQQIMKHPELIRENNKYMFQLLDRLLEISK